MISIDNVGSRLDAARDSADRWLKGLYEERLQKKRLHISSKYKDKPAYKYNYTRPNRGRYIWAVKSKGYLDYLPVEVAWLAVSPMDYLGEHYMVMGFRTCVHHNTLRYILNKYKLEVLYIRGSTRNEMEKYVNENNFKYYCRDKL